MIRLRITTHEISILGSNLDKFILILIVQLDEDFNPNEVSNETSNADIIDLSSSVEREDTRKESRSRKPKTPTMSKSKPGNSPMVSHPRKRAAVRPIKTTWSIQVC